MHRGFNVELSWEDEEYFKKGLTQFKINRNIIANTLRGFIGDNGVLKGRELQSNWFPQVEADIFISHSHQDRKKAISLAAWLEEEFGLKVFIDSCIWGYADNLLKIIDNFYCLNPIKQTYNYERRNQSTSHVHIMLSTSLCMMIDRAECLFFLNTPNSIHTAEAINKTKSPWIYNEIVLSKIIRKRKLKEYRPEFNKAFSLGKIDEGLSIDYEVDIEHLQNLTLDNLILWQENWNNASPQKKYPLDILYNLMSRL